MLETTYLRQCGHTDFFRWEDGDPHFNKKAEEFVRTRCAFCLKREREQAEAANLAGIEADYSGYTLKQLEDHRRALLRQLHDLDTRAAATPLPEADLRQRHGIVRRLTTLNPILKQKRRAAYNAPTGKERGVRTRHDVMEDVLIELKGIHSILQTASVKVTH